MTSRLIAAAALLASSAPLAAQQIALAPGETLLEVSANGIAKGVPDRVEISTGVTTDAASAQAALKANGLTAARLMGAIRAAGVGGVDIQTRDLSVRPRFRRDKDDDETSDVVGYRAINRLSFRTANIGDASRLIDALFAAGATDLQGPNFSFADDSAMRRAARFESVSAARREADDYAKALGLHVTRILRVSERSARSDEGGDIIVTGMRSGSSPIEPGQQSVSVTTWIDYALSP